MLDKDKNIKIATEMVKKLNEKDNLFIPILDGFQIEKEMKNGFVASNGKGTTEKFIWEENTSFDFKEKIKRVLGEAMSFGLKNNLTIDNIFSLGDYDIPFHGSTYMYDIIMSPNQFVREITYYFLSDNGKVFNQVSFSSGPYDVSKYKLLKDIPTTEFKNEKLTKSLYGLMALVMKNIKK